MLDSGHAGSMPAPKPLAPSPCLSPRASQHPALTKSRCGMAGAQIVAGRSGLDTKNFLNIL